MPTKKIIQADERAVRATDDGATFDVSCPHCDAPVEVQARNVPLPTRRAADIEALTTRATTAESKLSEAEKRAALITSEKEAAEKRAASLEARAAGAEGALKVYRDAHIASEIDRRIGTKMEPAERADEIEIAERLLADTTPDPDKPGHTLGEKKWAARLAKIDGRRDFGLLGPAITGGDQRQQSGAAPAQQRSAVDEINTMASAASN
jgi:hypothetical protein